MSTVRQMERLVGQMGTEQDGPQVQEEYHRLGLFLIFAVFVMIFAGEQWSSRKQLDRIQRVCLAS